MAPCTEEQRAFVNRHVGIFADRHWKKLNQISPVKTAKDVIQESNNTSLIQAFAKIDLLEEELIAATVRFKEALEAFRQEFEPTVEHLHKASMAKHMTELKKKQEAFEYKLRTAIGLVELVSPKKAYQVLEECREEIEELGRE